MSESRTLSVGLDVHKESIAGASVAHEHGAEVVSLGTIGTRQCAMDKLRRPLQSKGQHRVGVYAADPCGSWLSRSLTKQGDVGGIVAPSCMPTKPGDRVNTDRRDARPLARLMRAGDLPPVYGPAVDDEASRDLRRARDETLRALKAATLRRQAFVLRHAIRSPGRATWSPPPLRWRSEVVWPTPAPHMVCQAYVQTVTAQTARLQRLAHALREQGQTWRFPPVVEALQALRGVQGTVAVTPGAARGALTRCEPPRQLRHSLGLTPSAYARGPRRQQGSRPKPGKTQARRALGEGAWASRYPATVRRPLPLRRAKLPTAIQALRGPAHVRLGTRDRQRMATGNQAHPVVVAMARACRAFLGAMAQQVVVPPKAYRWWHVATQACEVSTRSRQRRSPGGVSPSAA
jgi:transposase